MQPTITKSTLKAAVTERCFVIIKWIKCRLPGAKPEMSFYFDGLRQRPWTLVAIIGTDHADITFRRAITLYQALSFFGK
jgi:hypothetical protein